MKATLPGIDSSCCQVCKRKKYDDNKLQQNAMKKLQEQLGCPSLRDKKDTMMS